MANPMHLQDKNIFQSIYLSFSIWLGNEAVVEDGHLEWRGGDVIDLGEGSSLAVNAANVPVVDVVSEMRENWYLLIFCLYLKYDIFLF